MIGEVVNTADCGSVMQEFDPLIAPHIEIYAHLVLNKDKFIILGIMDFFLCKDVEFISECVHRKFKITFVYKK